MHRHSTWEPCAVELLQCAATLPQGSGQCHSCNALPHYQGAMASATLSCTASLPWGSRQCNSCNTLPHCLMAVGSGPPVMHCHIPQGQWAVELPQSTPLSHGGTGRCNLCNTLPHRFGGGGGAPAAVPRTVSLGVVPLGSHADQPRESSVLPPLEQDTSHRSPKNAPPSRLSGSQRRCTTTLRSDLLSGPGPGHGHRPLRTVLDPPEVACQDQRDGRCWSPGASPPT